MAKLLQDTSLYPEQNKKIEYKMNRTVIYAFIIAALLSSCSTSKKGTDTGTAEVAAPKENQARVEKVTAPPTNTQAQKAEILYDK